MEPPFPAGYSTEFPVWLPEEVLCSLQDSATDREFYLCMHIGVLRGTQAPE